MISFMLGFLLNNNVKILNPLLPSLNILNVEKTWTLVGFFKNVMSISNSKI
jgi:hypothetical protein